MAKNRICELFQIQYPIVQGGMIWCSDWRLASAVSNTGGLGLIGAGAMDADTLREQIVLTKKATQKPFGINVPLISKHADSLMQEIVDEKVGIVFTSAGNPKTWTSLLHEKGIKVAHVVSGSKFAIKAQEAGVDAIVAEGFEAGGHNGREETTTLILIPAVRAVTDLPLIAAGGIGSGKAMLASLVLGAEGVQIGSRFVTSTESSAHQNFKEMIVASGEGDTKLTMKKLIPVRLLKNKFSEQIEEAEQKGADRELLSQLLGRGRAKLGMFAGDTEDGELEIGQVSTLIHRIQPVQEIIDEIISDYRSCMETFNTYNFTF
jgi:enoyl-[acyl-carrier protein] reductase II